MCGDEGGLCPGKSETATPRFVDQKMKSSDGSGAIYNIELIGDSMKLSAPLA